MSNKKIFIYLIFLFTLILHNTFLNSYIIIRNNYSERVLKYGGFCSPYGYGFVKFIREKYNLEFNFDVLNYNDLPNINYFFYKFKNTNNNNYLALIGISEILFKEIYENKYVIIEKNENCYFVLKK
jgi:hypothetical protein